MTDQILVAGVDTSTQSCKIVVTDALTGTVVRSGRATHPDGTEIDPQHWWDAFTVALTDAGGLADVSALAVGGQQHGMVVLDEAGRVIRPALLWNDTRSAAAAADLVSELGAQAWAEAIGSVPVASLTITKLRWLRENEPENAARVAAVCLPHDWLTWRIAGYGPQGDPSAPLGPDLSALRTDRSDASGTGYVDASANGGQGAYRLDLLGTAFGRDDVILPTILAPDAVAGTAHPSIAGSAIEGGALLGPGAGDNAAASLGLNMIVGDVAVSIGTSGVVSAIAPQQSADASGLVTGFADATGAYLPLACTLNASRILDAGRTILGVDHAELSELALAAQSGAAGLSLVPYLEGERTPNRPDATGTLHGITLGTATRENIARAFVEGLICLLADGLEALRAVDVPVNRILLTGGGAQSEAVRQIAPSIFGLDVLVPVPGEYVALGAARQAAWVLAVASGAVGSPAPDWELEGLLSYSGAEQPQVLRRYHEVRDLA